MTPTCDEVPPQFFPIKGTNIYRRTTAALCETFCHWALKGIYIMIKFNAEIVDPSFGFRRACPPEFLETLKKSQFRGNAFWTC